MRLSKAFRVTVGILLGGLLLQLAVRISSGPGVRTFAVWKNNPANLTEAKKLANQIVTGQVTKIERAEDIVVPAPGEPGNEVRIPVEAVTFSIDASHKGARGQTLEVFHTGVSVGVPAYNRPEPPATERPPEPAGGVPRPAEIPARTEHESRTVLLAEDPEYRVGEKYVLLLMDGPTLKVRGAPVKTKALVSPAGRHRVGADGKIEPVSPRGFVGQLKGRALQEFEAELKRP